MVLINGSLARFFSSLRGLRQGDPPSPMLSLLMIEEFNKMLKRREGLGLIGGFRADGVGGGVCIFHLLFTNDTILFCDTVAKQILHIRMLLLCFQA